MKAEDLSRQLLRLPMFKDPWLNLIPRGAWDVGTGLSQSAFTIMPTQPGDSEPNFVMEVTSGGVNSTDGSASFTAESNNEQWTGSSSKPIQGASACQQGWTQLNGGYLERKYGPSLIQFMTPMLCKQDLELYWQSAEFWAAQFQSIDMGSTKHYLNRLASVYDNYVPVTACTGGTGAAGISFTAPMHFVSQSATVIVAPKQVDISNLGAPTASWSEVSQDHLDMIAETLNFEAQFQPDSSGWCALGESGPLYSLLIGQGISNRLTKNNSEFRTDLRYAYQGDPNNAPFMLRIGATKVIKNFRHVITTEPPRWDFITHGNYWNGTTWVDNAVALSATGNTDRTSATCSLYTDPASGVVYPGVTTGTAYTTLYNHLTVDTNNAALIVTLGGWGGIQSVPAVAYTTNGGAWVRRTPWIVTADSSYVTKGYKYIPNSDYTKAGYEGIRVMSPMVYEARPRVPMGSVGKASFNVHDYMGEWDFIKGLAAQITTAEKLCPDPLGDRGRFFGQYRQAEKPLQPEAGRLIVFKRCIPGVEKVVCPS